MQKFTVHYMLDRISLNFAWDQKELIQIFNNNIKLIIVQGACIK